MEPTLRRVADASVTREFTSDWNTKPPSETAFTRKIKAKNAPGKHSKTRCPKTQTGPASVKFGVKKWGKLDADGNLPGCELRHCGLLPTRGRREGLRRAASRAFWAVEDFWEIGEERIAVTSPSRPTLQRVDSGPLHQSR